MIDIFLGLIARTYLQRFWIGLYRLAIGGLGYMNANPRTNGENRHLASWEKSINRSTSNRGKPFIVLDVGANEGDFTENILKLLNNVEVHCFEPNPATCARLRTRFGNDNRVVINEMGVGSKLGKLVLRDYQNANGTGHASFLPDTFTDIYPAETIEIEVPVTTIDQYLSDNGLVTVDYLKIDVEGFEHYVFEGMKESVDSGNVKVVQFEFNAHNVITGLTLYKISKMLKGFEIHKILANGTEVVLGEKVPYNARVEIFKFSNFVAYRRG